MKHLLCFYDDEDMEPTTKSPVTVKVSNVMPSCSNFARNILGVSVKLCHCYISNLYVNWQDIMQALNNCKGLHFSNIH